MCVVWCLSAFGTIQLLVLAVVWGVPAPSVCGVGVRPHILCLHVCAFSCTQWVP